MMNGFSVLNLDVTNDELRMKMCVIEISVYDAFAV